MAEDTKQLLICAIALILIVGTLGTCTFKSDSSRREAKVKCVEVSGGDVENCNRLY